MRPALAVLLYSLLIHNVLAVFVNRTVDDQLGDEATGNLVTYTPPALWTQGNNCTGCAFRPDNKSAFDGTWHDGSFDPAHGDDPLTFSFKFNGTAIYLFNILTRLTLLDVNVSLDGTIVGNYNRFQNVSVFTQYEYNVPIFSLNSIPYGEHLITVVAAGQKQTNVLFDYAIYTTNTTASDIPTTSGQQGGGSSDSTKRHINVGAIVGGVVGGVALIGTCIIAWLLYRRWHHTKSPSTRPDPFQDRGRNAPPPAAPLEPPIERSEKSEPILAIGIPEPSTGITPSNNSVSPSTPTSVFDEDARSLQQQIQFFRNEFEAIRTKTSSRSDVKSNLSRGGSSMSASSMLASELAMLRAEVEQLRKFQETKDGSPIPATPTSSAGTDLLRELAVLRGQMEEMRIQHEINLGPLPEYTPPPPRNAGADSRPLPSAPGVGRPP